MFKVNPSIFKAYDIRGVYPDEINEETAYRIGRAFVMFLSAKLRTKKLKIIVGRDVRLSSPSMRESLTKGIIDQGADIIDIGICTSPVHYYAVSRNNAELHAEQRRKNDEADGGVMVTASHNPKEYNGFKILSRGGVSVGEETGMSQIRDLTEKGDFQEASRKGEIIEKDISDEYVDFVTNGINISRKLKIVIDGSNGTVGLILPRVLERLDFCVYPCSNPHKSAYVSIHLQPDGSFPNHDPNPTKEENLADLKKKVLESGADLGIAFDGDGDRVVFINEKGERISSDLITLLVALGILDKKQQAKIIHDLTLGKVVRETIREKGGIPIESRVGHTLIKNKMRETGAEFGGERSGHYFFKEFFYGDAAILAALKILEILAASGKKISELASPFQKYCSSGEVNFEVKDKNAILKKIESKYSDAKINHTDGLTVEYKDWWFNVRPSNTEPFLRLNLEADTEALFKEKLNEVRELIKNYEL